MTKEKASKTTFCDPLQLLQYSGFRRDIVCIKQKSHLKEMF